MTGSIRLRGGRVAAWAALTALVLALPLVAMQFSDEVAWDAFDFVVMGTLIFGIGIAYELVASRVSVSAYRAGVGVALAGGFLMLWMNGAVGLVGNEGDAVNLLFPGVLAVGGIGALVARFAPEGMTRALLATALSQLVAGGVAFAVGWMSEQTDWQRDALAMTGFFTSLWLTSALLFRAAAHRQAHGPGGALA